MYVTQVMMDAGFAETDPALMLCHWKYYLRSATNALIDVGIHTAGMTEAEAIDLMVDGGVPGAGRRAGEVRPGPALVDAALDLLRREHGVLGARARGP